MKTHHILGILWLILCSVVTISACGWLRNLLSAHDFSLTLNLILASFMVAAYLAGAVASVFLCRGLAWAWILVGIIAVLSIVACIAQLVATGRLSAFAAVLGICAVASLVPLWSPRRYVIG